MKVAHHPILHSLQHLPDFPTRDPADELIVASARIHKLTLITSDKNLKSYRHARIHYFKPLPDRARGVAG